MNNSCECETKSCIACNVSNCIHHTKDNTCAAGKIQVGNGMAQTCKDTCCDTFKANQSNLSTGKRVYF